MRDCGDVKGDSGVESSWESATMPNELCVKLNVLVLLALACSRLFSQIHHLTKFTSDAGPMGMVTGPVSQPPTCCKHTQLTVCVCLNEVSSVVDIEASI
jgi:hypothetical protein